MVQGEIYPSLIAAGGYVFSADKAGRVVVYRPKSDHTLELVAENNLGDPKRTGGSDSAQSIEIFLNERATAPPVAVNNSTSKVCR